MKYPEKLTNSKRPHCFLTSQGTWDVAVSNCGGPELTVRSAGVGEAAEIAARQSELLSKTKVRPALSTSTLYLEVAKDAHWSSTAIQSNRYVSLIYQIYSITIQTQYMYCTFGYLPTLKLDF